MGDTLLWELLERLNLRDLVADGGLEAKVRSDERVIDCNENDYICLENIKRTGGEEKTEK